MLDIMEKPYEIHKFSNISLFLIPKVQFQGIKIYSSKAEAYLVLFLHPGPWAILIGKNDQGEVQIYEFKEKIQGLPFPLVTHPLSLYLKAHFVGQRIASCVQQEGPLWVLEFYPSGAILKIRPKLAFLEFECEVPGRKTFHTHLSLAKWMNQSLEKELPSKESSGAGPFLSHAQEKKIQKTLTKIELDKTTAEDWLASHRQRLKALEENPTLWRQAESAVNFEPLKAKFKNLEELFNYRRRMQRKVDLAQKRLQEYQKSAQKMSPQAPSQGRGPNHYDLPSAKLKKKRPGLSVQIDENLWVQVGRKQEENAELLRTAQASDLWFHVKGQAGAHVWLSRNQWPKGQKVKEEWLRKAAQVAMKYSKMKIGSSAYVDYTEKKYLKALKGSVGQVIIQKSKSLFLRFEEEKKQGVSS